MVRIIPDYARFDKVFSKVGQSGYAIALGVVNVTPEINYSTYPKEWLDQYLNNRYAWLDPVVQYLAFGEGEKRWSELTGVKLPVFSKIIMREARKYGLEYGLVIVRRDATDRRKKHMLSLARSDRELTDNEIARTFAVFDELLKTVTLGQAVTDRQVQILTLFAQGQTRQSVASKVGVSEETVKKDIEAVRRNWNAKNTTEAVGLAISRKIIDPYTQTRW